MNEYTIAAVPANLIDVLWDKLSPHLEKVVELARDEITMESVKGRVMKGDGGLVAICSGPDIVAVNILEVRTFDSGYKALYIPIVGGTELDGWRQPFYELCRQVASDFGCSELRGIAARKGWLRKLNDGSPSSGWEEVSTIIRLKL